MPQLAGGLKEGGDLPDVPVIVLTTLGVDPGMRLLASQVAARDGRRQAASVRGAGRLGQPGEHRTPGDAQHSTLTTDRPDAVIQAIGDLLARASHQPGGPPAIAGPDDHR